MSNDLLFQETELAPVVPPAAEPTSKKWLRRTSITAGVTALTLVSGAGLYLASVNNNIERADLMTSVGAAPNSAKDALNIVILGSGAKSDDSKASKGGDVVMVLHISGDRKDASLVSFPRAMYVDVPGKGMETLSSTYAMGGAKLTVSTLEDVLDTRMDHAMVADYKGFTDLAQQVGAVTVDNPSSVQVGGYSYAKGSIKLEGAKLQAYVKPVPGEDAADQALRQRLVLEAGMKKGLSKSTLSSPKKLNKFVKTATSNVTVDKSFTGAAITKIAASLNLKSNDITLVRAPLSDSAKTVDGEDVQEVDATQFKELASALSDDKLDNYISDNGTE